MAAVPPSKFMVDTYLDWARNEGVPIHEDFGVDLLAAKTAYWPRFGVNGAIIHVTGRGDFMTVFLLEIPPGGKITPQKHLFEASFYVLAGNGTAVVEGYARHSHQFEWGTHSVFAPPLNTRYQFFNVSGQTPARLAMSCNLPCVLNLFHDENFVFNNPGVFPDREGPRNHFSGEGEFIPVRPGKNMWETSFVPDVSSFKLYDWSDRGKGAAHIQLILANSVMHSHISQMPVGTYKKAHRHGPDAHIYIISGEGYSLLFHEGDKDFIRVDWKPGWIFAPPDMMFHQHFNSGTTPVRYIAFIQGNVRYPLMEGRRKVYAGIDVDVKKGGNQIEYRDQDPRIHQMFIDEMAKKSLTVKMDELFAPASSA